MRKKLAILSVAILSIPVVVLAAPEPKYFVCKYVGTPGTDERLQTGNNPISVSGNAITPPVTIGAYFNDAQGRSLVIAEDTGQDEPDCPLPQNPNPPTPPTPPTPPATPTPATQPTQSVAPESSQTPIVGK